jgi:transposase InsO family protein
MSWRRAGSFFHSISNPCNRVACEPGYGLFLGTADPATSCGDLVKTGSRWHGSCAGTASGRGRPPLSCLHDRQQAFPSVAENLLDQNFVADRPDQVWLADITYIPTSDGGSAWFSRPSAHSEWRCKGPKKAVFSAVGRDISENPKRAAIDWLSERVTGCTVPGPQ